MPEKNYEETKEQVGPFEYEMLSPADEIRMKFSAQNFVTPKMENNPYQSKV